ncbi:hypothetical protein DXA74_08450 [Bacteroides sp. OF04-15BH]|nr:hypothetical protein DXA74_08450 [Bacteroides sp. OF04-15BH]
MWLFEKNIKTGGNKMEPKHLVQTVRIPKNKRKNKRKLPESIADKMLQKTPIRCLHRSYATGKTESLGA